MCIILAIAAIQKDNRLRTQKRSL